MTGFIYNDQKYYNASEPVSFMISELCYSTLLDYRSNKSTYKVSGKGVCFFQGFHVIKCGYSSNLIQITIRDITEDDELNLNTQLQKAKSNKWKSFLGIYYEEKDEEELDDIHFIDDLDQEKSLIKISCEVYLPKDQIEQIIYLLRQNSIDNITMECSFLDLLSDNPFYFPGSLKYIPPQEGISYNCVGQLNQLNINNKPSYLTYREITGNQITTVSNPLDSEFQKLKQKDELLSKINEIRNLLNLQIQNQKIITNEISYLKYIIIFLLIFCFTYLLY